MALTHAAVLKASASETACKLSGGDGLHLLVRPGGSKLRRFRYRYGGKENMLALGSFPEVSLTAARSRRDDANKLLAEGTDPSTQRKLDKVAAAVAAANTFGAITTEYLDRLKQKGCSDRSAASAFFKACWGCDVHRGAITLRCFIARLRSSYLSDWI